MGYYCISNVITEGCENRIFQVCNRQLRYFFSIQSYGRAYPTPQGALPNMWRKYKRKTLVENKGVDRHVRLLRHVAWNAACSNHFLWRGRICSRGFTILTDFHFATCLYTVWSHEVAVSCIHCYWLWVAFVPCREEFDLWCDWAFSLTSFEMYSASFVVVAAKQPFNRDSRSLRWVFRGARLSFLTTNACSTENNISFPNLANHIVLSKLWKLDLERWVIQ